MMLSASRLSLVLLATASLALTGCMSYPEFEDQTLGDQFVTASTLTEGHDNYMLYCRACHGEKGDGRGASAVGLRPPPRNLQQGLFKFGWVVDGLPRDEDLKRIIQGGLHGTAMLEWDITDAEVMAVIQYIKTFSPEWKEEDFIGSPVVPPTDPWGPARTAEAVKRGELVYHGLATCWSCHPAYVDREEISRSTQTLKGVTTDSFRPNLYFGELKESEYLVGEHAVKILPPDFTFHPIRSMREGNELDDLYRIIGSGIPGTAMPQWEGALPAADTWALVYYTKHLADMRDKPEADSLRRRLLEEDERWLRANPAATGL